MNRTLEHILPKVQKPARYTGGEYNAIVKDRRTVDTRYALCFPDTYEIGMSNLGCRILYGLMNEVDDLLQQVLDCPAAESLSYQQAFLRYLEIDPLSADKTQLREVAAKLDLSNVADTEEDRDTLLQLLFTFGVEPNIGKEKPTFVYHFPASQASLAQISTEDHRVAERFEVYYKGIELANGFHELTDAREQQQRFEQDNRKRAARGLPQHPIDQNLIEALKVGMPDCSGVALGVDRLVMLALGAETLAEVIAFSVDRA